VTLKHEYDTASDLQAFDETKDGSIIKEVIWHNKEKNRFAFGETKNGSISHNKGSYMASNVKGLVDASITKIPCIFHHKK
jgi:hypothetical protein